MGVASLVWNGRLYERQGSPCISSRDRSFTDSEKSRALLHVQIANKRI